MLSRSTAAKIRSNCDTGAGGCILSSDSWQILRRISSWISLSAARRRQLMCFHSPKAANPSFFLRRYYGGYEHHNRYLVKKQTSFSTGVIFSDLNVDAGTNPRGPSSSSSVSISEAVPSCWRSKSSVNISLSQGHSRRSWVLQEVSGWMRKISRSYEWPVLSTGVGKKVEAYIFAREGIALGAA